MIGTARIIDGDLFFIAARLKEIDSSYFLVENYKTGKYEVHSDAQRGGTLTLVLPYKTLDARAVDYVRKTRASRKKELIEEMERHNAEMEKKRLEELSKKIEKEVESEFSSL